MTIPDEPADDPGNIRFREMLTHMREMWRQFDAAILLLPEAPEDGKCQHCGNDELYLEEAGYCRYTQAELVTEDEDDHYWVSITDGWDDMSESGETLNLVCWACFTRYQAPDDINWN
jgi:hypothetical protein